MLKEDCLTPPIFDDEKRVKPCENQKKFPFPCSTGNLIPVLFSLVATYPQAAYL